MYILAGWLGASEGDCSNNGVECGLQVQGAGAGDVPAEAGGPQGQKKIPQQNPGNLRLLDQVTVLRWYTYTYLYIHVLVSVVYKYFTIII